MNPSLLGILLSVSLVTASLTVRAAEKEPEPTLPATGVNLARPSSGWLNFVVETNRFVVRFFDEEKKPARADSGHAFVRYIYAAKKPERIALNRSADGRTLISAPRVRPPHVFRVYLTVFGTSGTEPIETHAFQYP